MCSRSLKKNKVRLLSGLLLFSWLVCPLGQAFADEAAASKHLAESATNFITSIEGPKKDKILRPFTDEERTDWHFFPKTRKGLSLADLNEVQSERLWRFLETALSESGLAKAKGVIAAERILWEQSNRASFRDPKKYHIVFFGEPSAEQSWGASFEGHHLSINLTLVDGKDVYVTPSFFGANPDIGPEGNRPLEKEYKNALALLKSLDAEQLKSAFDDGRPTGIVTRALPKVDSMQPQGLPAGRMSKAQQALLMELIRAYVGRYREALAEEDLRKIKAAGVDKIHFLWVGGTEPGEAVYYRVQGPSFIMEYANRQNGANHSHTVWRDFENDFGYDALRQHLDAVH